jgi:putative transposase
MNIQWGVKNRKLARAMSDADLGMPREFIAYKGFVRGNTVEAADRFYPSLFDSAGEDWLTPAL